jgi:AraC-like DNA-binding protein
MGNIFKINCNRKIYIASKNFFREPIKHPSRTQNEHVISYVINGGWELEIGGETIKAVQDCVFIQPAKIPHVGTKLCPPKTSTMFVHFSVEEGDEYTFDESVELSDDCLFIGNLIDASANPEIKKLLIKIIEETAKENHIKASIYLNLFLCELSEEFSSTKNDIAHKIKNIIKLGMNKNITNREIARELKIGIRTAEINFKSRFGTTIHRYTIEQKINQAKFFLKYYPDMKIIQIALDLGFYDEYHFSRLFKKETGYSPKHYREYIRNNKNAP